MGLSLAKTLNSSLLWTESDSQLLVNILNVLTAIPLSISHIINNIKKAVSELDLGILIYLEKAMVLQISRPIGASIASYSVLLLG